MIHARGAIHATMRAMRCLWAILLVGAAGCADDACAELEAVCGLCPDDDQGRIARASCERTVASGDELACRERTDQRTYAAYGCR